MPDDDAGQPFVDAIDNGIDELLRVHRAISAAWYLDWHAGQQTRLEKLFESRAIVPSEPGALFRRP